MKKRILLLCIVLFATCAALPVQAEETRQTDNLEFVDGHLWQRMSHDEKISMLWGMGQVIRVEQALMEQRPELRVENFSAKVVEGLADVPLDVIAETADLWYARNPDKLDQTLIRVLWDEMIRPNIRTGIAGAELTDN